MCMHDPNKDIFTGREAAKRRIFVMVLAFEKRTHDETMNRN